MFWKLENMKSVYLKKHHVCEAGIANRIKMILQVPQGAAPIDVPKEMNRVQKQLAIQPADNQVEAIKTAMRNKVSIITGGPGTGKTTIIHAILKLNPFTFFHFFQSRRNEKSGGHSLSIQRPI